MPDLPEKREEVTHLCPACDDEFSSARAGVIRALGVSVAFTPPLMLILSFVASYNHVALVVDDKILVGCLAAWATIIAYVFKKGWDI